MIRPRRLRAHDAPDGLADEVQSRQVHLDDPVPFGRRKLIDRHAVPERVHPGVVDQDIDLSVLPNDLLRNGLDLGFVADVHLHCLGAR